MILPLRMYPERGRNSIGTETIAFLCSVRQNSPKIKQMVVSILQLIIEIPESASLKDKRREIKSLKDRLQDRYKLSVAEVDLNDSIHFAHLGAAIVSNSARFGESVLHKAIEFAERNVYGRLVDVKIFSEQY